MSAIYTITFIFVTPVLQKESPSISQNSRFLDMPLVFGDGMHASSSTQKSPVWHLECSPTTTHAVFLEGFSLWQSDGQLSLEISRK